MRDFPNGCSERGVKDSALPFARLYRFGKEAKVGWGGSFGGVVFNDNDTRHGRERPFEE